MVVVFFSAGLLPQTQLTWEKHKFGIVQLHFKNRFCFVEVALVVKKPPASPRDRWEFEMAPFPSSSDSKASVYNAGDLGSIPGLGRFPGEGHGNPLQYSCLENLMGRGAWRTTVHRVTKIWTGRKQFSTKNSFNFPVTNKSPVSNEISLYLF